ncbi:retrovirus-related pol polyprotein from transposon TNT 1-94 [Tanacetum coccineum]|uniref:Retrovirus-related pol polyprotein from transposon TNT 1-94 n=1 Tax=Tanacetum coccineum TaxID=301880 RepID=A0ABQ5GEW3_9ASTR
MIRLKSPTLAKRFVRTKSLAKRPIAKRLFHSTEGTTGLSETPTRENHEGMTIEAITEEEIFKEIARNVIGISVNFMKDKKRKVREATESWMNIPISFPTISLEDMSEEPLIVEAKVEGYLNKGPVERNPYGPGRVRWGNIKVTGENRARGGVVRPVSLPKRLLFASKHRLQSRVGDGIQYKCFLDAYKGYHQIQMAEEDEEKMHCNNNQGTTAITKIPSGLKNAGPQPKINRSYEASKDNMIKYLAKAMEYASEFKSFSIENIPRNMIKKQDYQGGKDYYMSNTRPSAETTKNSHDVHHGPLVVLSVGHGHPETITTGKRRCQVCNRVGVTTRSHHGTIGAQLVNNPFKSWCKRFEIRQMNRRCVGGGGESATRWLHPQANRLVERANRSLMEGKERDGGYYGSKIQNKDGAILQQEGSPTFKDILIEEDTRSIHITNDLRKIPKKTLLTKSKRFFKKVSKSRAIARRARPGPKQISQMLICRTLARTLNKGLIAEAYEWDKEEVSSDNNEMVEVKVLMALAKENNDVSKEGAKNGEWVKISMRKVHTLLEMEDNDDRKLSEAEGFILPSHDTGRLLPSESQRNTTNPSVAVTDSSATNYDSADESLVCSTPVPPLKKLDGAKPISGPKTIKSILRSKSTFKAKALKSVIINEPSSAPAKGNKSYSALKVYSASASKLKSMKIEDDPPLAICGIKKPIWYLDSRCSRYMTGVKSYLHKYVEQPGPKVVFGDDSTCTTEGYGCIKCNGIVFTKFDEKRGTIFNSNKEIVMIAPRVKDVYVLDMTSSAQESCFFAKASENLNWLWHKRLAHLNLKTINKLAKQNLVIGLPLLVYSKDKPCSSCEKGKHHRVSFKIKQTSSIKKRLHFIHMDLFRPVTLRSINHEKYTLVIIDEYSRNSTLVNFCDEKGISQNFSSPYTPEQNGVAERKNRTLIEATRTMLSGSIFSKQYWIEAVATACYTQNRSTIVKRHLKTPYEIFRKRIPNISFLYVFGCPVYLHNHKDHLRKFDEKVDDDYLIGYSLVSKAFRVFNTRTQQTEETYHITFDESLEAIKFSKPSVDNINIVKSENIHLMNINLLKGFDLKGYSDSDYASCNTDRKSTSAKAEYVAAAGCCANILWMKSQLIDYDIIYEKVPIFYDNTSAIAISNNLVLHSRQSTLIPDITSSEIIFSKGTLNYISFPLNINLLISSPSLLNEQTIQKKDLFELGLPDSKISVSTPTGEVRGEIGYNGEIREKGTLKKSCLPPRLRLLMVDYARIIWEDLIHKLNKKTREKIVPYPRFISLLLEHIAPKYDNEELTISPTQVFSVHNWILKPNQPEEPPFTDHMKAICNLDVHVDSKAPKYSSLIEEVPQGKKVGARSGLRRKQSSKHTSESTIEASKSESCHSKKETRSSSAMDISPSHPSPPTPMVGEMHKEEQQAASGPTSISQLKLILEYLLLRIPYLNNRIWMKEQKNYSFTHILAGSNPSVLIDKTKFAGDGLKTANTTSGVNEESGADDISQKVKLEDLLDLLKDTRSAFFTPDSPTDEPVIVLDVSEEEENAENDKYTEDTLSRKEELEQAKVKAEAEVTSMKAKPSYPDINQLTELLVTSLKPELFKLLASHDFASFLPTELKELPSNITRLSEEIKELKQHIKDTEIELHGDLIEIPTKLESFTSTISSLSSQIGELKNIQRKPPTEFLNLPSQISSVQEKLKTLDSLPNLLHKVFDTLNRFSTVMENASGAASMGVPSARQAPPSPVEGEKNTKDASTNLKHELIDLLGKYVMTQYYTTKLLFDKYCDKMLKRKKNPKITNCEVLTKKGIVTLKIYREGGSEEVISNLKVNDLHLAEWREILQACPDKSEKGWKTIYDLVKTRVDQLTQD